MKVHTILLWLVAIVLVLGVDIFVIQGERLATTGELIYLELVPVDPRSLIQGDYMRLRYAISGEAERQAPERKGTLVLGRDPNSIGRFVRFGNPGIPLAPNEVQIKYYRRGYDVYIGPEAFFFQEGHASFYTDARYAELRVSESGDVLLVGLRGENLEPLGPPD